MKTLNLNIETIIKYTVYTAIIIIGTILIVESFKIDNFVL